MTDMGLELTPPDQESSALRTEPCPVSQETTGILIFDSAFSLLSNVALSWGVLGQATPECATLARGLFRPKSNQGPTDSGTAFFPLRRLKEFR